MIRRIVIVAAMLAAGFSAGYFAARKPIVLPSRPTYEQVADRVLPRVDLRATTYAGAVRYVHDVTGLDVVATWPATEKGIHAADMPFDPDLSLHDITVGQLFGRLNRANDRYLPGIIFRLGDGFLHVEPAEGIPNDLGEDAEAESRNTVTCVYDVEKLVLNDGPWERLLAPYSDMPIHAPLTIPQRQEFLQRGLRHLLEPDSWKDAGGVTGSMRIIDGQLIVTQTPPNQRAIYEIIKTLREAK